MSRFDQIWIRLAKQGACDGRGGAEYRRVKEEWELLFKPSQIKNFIIARTNPPGGAETLDQMIIRARFHKLIALRHRRANQL